MQSQQLVGGNFCTSSGLLTATGAETVYDTTVTITFAVNGKAYTKTAITDGATPTTDGVSGSTFTGLTASEGCVFLWCLNASGTVKVLQGPVTDLDPAGDFILAPQFPAVPDTLTPFAYHIVQAGSTTVGTWDFGTDNWNATGITNTIVNLLVMPSRPQTS